MLYFARLCGICAYWAPSRPIYAVRRPALGRRELRCCRRSGGSIVEIVVAVGSGGRWAADFAGDLLGPVMEEKALFLEIEEFGRLSENGAQGGGHLEGDEEEDEAPDGEVPGTLHAERPPGLDDGGGWVG